MNDKINRFTQQLSDAAPMPPELEGRDVPVPHSTLTAARVSVALAAVATLAAVGVLATRDSNDRQAVTPASATSSGLTEAIEGALPAGFTLQRVERTDINSAHAYAVNDRFEVLDIEIISAAPTDSVITRPDSTVEVQEPEATLPGTTPPTTTILPDSTPTTIVFDCNPPADSVPGVVFACEESHEAGAVIVGGPPLTEPADCITRVTSESASECLAYADESATSVPFGSVPEAVGGTGCIVYAPSTDEVPPTLPADCTVVVDPNPPTTLSAGSDNLVGPGEPLGALGHDLNGVPSPFSGYATESENLFVGVVLYSIGGTTDTRSVAETVLRNAQSIEDLGSAIDSLPEALAAIDPSWGPLEGNWSGRGLAIGSLSVSLATKAPSNATAGSDLVRVSFPGNLTGSGNDGSVYWHATTGADGRVYIAMYRPGDEDMITPDDAKALTQKLAEEAYGELAAIVESAGSYPITVDGITETTAIGTP